MVDATTPSLAMILVPVVVGGVIGIAGTLIGPWLLEGRRQAAEKKKRRAEKFEELVGAVYEHDHWLDTMRAIRVIGFEASATMSPWAKIRAITETYFPELEAPVRDLDIATGAYEKWMFDAAQKRLKKEEGYAAGHVEAMQPYVDKQYALLGELRKFARREFQ